MNTSCDINPSLSFTIKELQDELPGGMIQAIGTLPTLNESGNLDPDWLRQTIQRLISNKVIPNLIRPQLPTIPSTPSLPIPPPPRPPPPPPTPAASGCENQVANINCPTGTINSVNVSYGSWDPTKCSSRYTGPSVKKTYSLKPPNCIGQNSCTLPINNTTVGEDALPGHGKQWTASPVCSGSDGCGTYGFPISNSDPVRLYNQDECTESLGGAWRPWAMCYKDNNLVASESYSVKCAYLNNPSPDTAAINYQQNLTNYQNALRNISDIKAAYNAAVGVFNRKNAAMKAAFNTEYCFYTIRLKYGQKTFFTTASLTQIPSNNPSVLYKKSIISKLNLKQIIITQIASQIFQNDVPTIESFTGSMPLSDSDISAQHTSLTNALTKSELNKRMVAYTLEKNNANQNLLTLFGVLNVIAIGIIYGIASS